MTTNTSAACCTVPTVLSDYTPKGTIKSLGNFKEVYVTGPDSSTNAIVCVFDIFGFYPQTQQGADLIASTLKTTVYMPDFFGPEPAFPHDPFPPTTDEEKQSLGNFFATTAEPSKTTAKLLDFGNFLKTNSIASKIGVYGFCWGGKVTVMGGAEGTPFSAVSIIHPAMVAAVDYEKAIVPVALYPSGHESFEDYETIVGILSKKSYASLCDHKYYKAMHHGFAAARADLKDEENRKEFEDVYNRLANFFQKALE